MDHTIKHNSDKVEEKILALPVALAARYVVLTSRMVDVGANLGPLHTHSMGDGLFELRLKSAEGIAKVFLCTLIGRHIIMLHSFVKKTPKTPQREIKVAQTRMKEIKHANS